MGRVNPKKHPDYEGLVEIASYGNTSYKPFLFFTHRSKETIMQLFRTIMQHFSFTPRATHTPTTTGATTPIASTTPSPQSTVSLSQQDFIAFFNHIVASMNTTATLIHTIQNVIDESSQSDNADSTANPITNASTVHIIAIAIEEIDTHITAAIDNTAFVGELSTNTIAPNAADDAHMLDALATLPHATTAMRETWRTYIRCFSHPDLQATMADIADTGEAQLRALHRDAYGYLDVAQTLIRQPFFDEAGRMCLTKAAYATLCDMREIAVPNPYTQ